VLDVLEGHDFVEFFKESFNLWNQLEQSEFGFLKEKFL
jgi:hypothetical protein